MKHLLTMILCTALTGGLSAQNYMSMHFSQNHAKFKYTDTKGYLDENMKSDMNYGYGVSYNRTFDNGLIVRPQLGFKGCGSRSTYNSQQVEWEMDYLDINVAAGYLYTEQTLKPYVGAGLYFSILLHAEQRMLGATYDIKNSKVIEKHDLGINLFTGMQYQYSENAAAFIEMGYGLGLNQLELNSETDSQQKMNNRLFYLQMGLHFSINKPKTEEETN